jgi:hypothetical protein
MKLQLRSLFTASKSKDSTGKILKANRLFIDTQLLLLNLLGLTSLISKPSALILLAQRAVSKKTVTPILSTLRCLLSSH